MLLPFSIEDQDIIWIYDHKGIGEWLQDIIHHLHENYLGIS
jgi:hypothetical protein